MNSRWFSWYSVWKKPPRLDPILSAAIRQHPNIAARAEAAFARVVDQDHVDLGIVLPVQQRADHGLAHAQGQSVQRLGAIERNAADVLLDADQDFRVLGHHVKVLGEFVNGRAIEAINLAVRQAVDGVLGDVEPKRLLAGTAPHRRRAKGVRPRRG